MEGVPALAARCGDFRNHIAISRRVDTGSREEKPRERRVLEPKA